MTDRITEIISRINTDEYKEFSKNTSSTLEYNRKTDIVSRDFSWVPIVEETIPFLDNIIRNPKRFIHQEEDIVIVEKSKKISTETIEHLAQHTNFIQDIDEDGMIKPSKVLNVQKEDTWDLYENRFIYTLIKELSRFILKYTDRDLEEPHQEIRNVVNFTGKTSHKNEDIDVSINLETYKREEPENFNKQEMLDKIENLRNVVGDFENSQFIKSLSQAIPVKSPIRKTNIILKDPNFQRALTLWEFIKNSEIGEPEERKSTSEDLSNREVKGLFDASYFLEYSGLNLEISEEESSPELLADKILSLIEEYIDVTNISEKKLADFVNKEIKTAIKRKNNKDKDISKIFVKYITEHNEYIDSICNMI